MQAAIEEEMFTILDSNGDGVISKAEHQNKSRETRSLASKRAMFKQLDQDQDQLLTLSEMPDPAERLRRVDADEDGLVTKAEMRAAHAQRRARPAPEAG
jgi:Ca2+-binding EF-hand superfamily protein